MTNALTGDYEAVFEIAIPQLNGLLGTLHQNGGIPGATLVTPHSETGSLYDRVITLPVSGVFEDWVTGIQRAGPGLGVRDIQNELTAAAPPGAAQMLTDAFAELRAGWGNIPPIVGTVSGTFNLQASNVTVTVPNGSSSEIDVNVAIRAVYYPNSGTMDLPAPIHGNVQAAFEVSTVYRRWFGIRLLITPSSDDAKIQFIAAPSSGLSLADQNTLSVQVRSALRQGLTLLPVDLPRGFPFTLFKGLGSGPTQAIALPFQLSGAAPPASGVQPLSQSFVGTNAGFAVAVSSEYASSLIDPNAIRQQINNYTTTITINFGLWSASATYHFSFTSGPTLTFQNGGIEVSGTVSASGNKWWSPNGSVSFKQLVTLVLDVPTQAITPVVAGSPTVDPPWFISNDLAANIVSGQFHTALDPNGPIAEAVRNAFDNARAMLVKGVDTFDQYGGVSYTGVQITVDGVIVRGNITSLPRNAPVVNVGQTNGSFTAFESWIPAGGIDRFIWSWVEYSNNNIWSGVQKSFADEDRFIFPKPAAATQLNQICLEIEGTQTAPRGQQTVVTGGTVCGLNVWGLEPAINAPSWWGPVTLPVWQPNLAETTALRQAIAAHVSAQENIPRKEPLSQNVLVYFVDWETKAPLDSLNAALALLKSSTALKVVVVLQAGAFDVTRGEIESRLGLSGERRLLMQFTEDDEGGWTRMFAVSKRPSAYLINARREFVWKHEGTLDPKQLAAEIDQRLVATSAPQFRSLQLAIAPGDRTPDVSFETIDRDQYALHRLRGRELILNFWQSWSAPCLSELSRLQKLYEAGKETPFIVAFHGGNNRDAITEIQRRLGLTFALVQDSQQRVARQFGVQCWPTTIRVSADGRAQHVQFGTGHETASPRAA
jgi:peroxiredoxin